MATELAVQSERAFQKQPHIFLNAKVKTKTSRPGKGGRRWYKDVGLGFKTPKTAIEGTYIGMSGSGSTSDREIALVWRQDSAVVAQIANGWVGGPGAHAGMPSTRQEVPVHRPRLHPRPNPDWHRRLDQDAPNGDCPTRVPALYPEIRPVREATQELRSPCVSSFPS